jgi:hypothetical protein
MPARGEQACRIARVMPRDQRNVKDFFEGIATTLASFGLQEIEDFDSTSKDKVMEAQKDARAFMH